MVFSYGCLLKSNGKSSQVERPVNKRGSQHLIPVLSLIIMNFHCYAPTN
ncbi:hypothetical protein DsansV1_C42g0239271 [Dioscorea sansibarensis]